MERIFEALEKISPVVTPAILVELGRVWPQGCVDFYYRLEWKDGECREGFRFEVWPRNSSKTKCVSVGAYNKNIRVAWGHLLRECRVPRWRLKPQMVSMRGLFDATRPLLRVSAPIGLDGQGITLRFRSSKRNSHPAYQVGVVAHDGVSRYDGRGESLAYALQDPWAEWGRHCAGRRRRNEEEEKQQQIRNALRSLRVGDLVQVWDAWRVVSEAADAVKWPEICALSPLMDSNRVLSPGNHDWGAINLSEMPRIIKLPLLVRLATRGFAAVRQRTEKIIRLRIGKVGFDLVMHGFRSRLQLTRNQGGLFLRGHGPRDARLWAVWHEGIVQGDFGLDLRER